MIVSIIEKKGKLNNADPSTWCHHISIKKANTFVVRIPEPYPSNCFLRGLKGKTKV